MRPPARVAVYEPNVPMQNAGGPRGYLWQLVEGLKEVGSDGIEFLFEPQAGVRQPNGFAEQASKLKALSPALWRLGKTFLAERLRKEWMEIYFRDLDEYYLPARAEQRLREGNFDVLHCHTTLHALMGHNSLTRLGLRSKTVLVLTSHSPEKPAVERAAVIMGYGLAPFLVPRLKVRLDAIDTRGVEVVDHLIFPCENSRRAYETFWPEFETLVGQKPVSYLMTGIVDIGEQPDFDLDSGRTENRPLICYAGRHNRVKGYDLLVDAALPLVSRGDITVVVAGGAGPISAPEHRNWIEVGWTNKVHSLIKTCDVFVLPNRNTYFDLVAIEAMALGRPIIATDTGGNKTLATLSEEILLCEPTPEAIRGRIEDIAGDPARMAAIGAANRSAFLDYLTANKFAANYKSIMTSIAARGPRS